MLTAAPDDAGLLELWELGRARHTLDRGVLMLGAALPDAPYDELADLTVGARDAVLLDLRRALFGSGLDVRVSCPVCAQRLECALQHDTLRLPAAATPSIAVGEHRFRLPTSRDLARALTEPDVARVVRRLAEDCFVAQPGQPAGLDWSRCVLTEVEAAMAAGDPQADLELALHCPSCGHDWRAVFDIVAFLWEEIEARARRLLADVHLLARGYGWTEADVLALGAERRAAYVAMVTG